MIVYQIIDNQYKPVMFGNNVVPNVDADKIIQVSKEIAKQAHKFVYDGKKLKRKEGEYILTLEQIEEAEKQEEAKMSDGLPPSEAQMLEEVRRTEIEF